MRLRLFEKELNRLLQSRREHDFVIFGDGRDQDHYVQYMRHDGAIHGEVGALTWIGGDRKLRRQAETALGCLGFTGAGPRRNYSRDQLPLDARRLACLTELLFGAAYGETEDLTVLVMTRASREAAREHNQELNA
jgi:hypothetical protein